MPVTLNNALDDYYEVKRGSYAPRTWRRMSDRLEHWRGWVIHETQPDVYLADVCDPAVRYMDRYFNQLRPPRYAEASFNLYRQYVGGFWAYTRQRGWVHTNPMMYVSPLRVPHKIRLQLSADEQVALLDGANPRDRIALAVGMNTGLRAIDAMTLTIAQVNLDNDLIVAWIEKTDTEMILPITEELHAELVQWYEHYADVMGVSTLPSTWMLIPSMGYRAHFPRRPEMGGYITYKPMKHMINPERMIHEALQRIGLPRMKGEGFHVLRRSAARVAWDLAREDGVGDPIVIPQSLLGHKNRATTELYLGVTQQDAMRDDMMRGKPFLSRARVKDFDVA